MINTNNCGRIVLVVEDVEETRDGIKALLDADGYCVKVARDETSAVLSAQSETPDLILLSLGGKKNDLVATAARMRLEVGSADEIPIVVFCADGVLEGAEIELEPALFLISPENWQQLKSLLARLLTRPAICSGVRS